MTNTHIIPALPLAAVMASTTVALVTGANQGIGFEIAKQLAAHGLTVLIGSRDATKGRAAAQSIGGRAHAIQLDVTDQNSIHAAANRIEREFNRLDVLINNAAIYVPPSDLPRHAIDRKTARLTTVPIEDVKTLFETNVFGVISVTQAMLPLLRKAPSGRMILVGSDGGSLTRMTDRTKSYRLMNHNYAVSKTAANAVAVAFANALENTGIIVNIANPGYTATALTDFQGFQSIEEGAREPVRLALLGKRGATATFTENAGTIPW